MGDGDADFVDGGAGDDILYGFNALGVIFNQQDFATDTFLFDAGSGNDTIQDWEIGFDQIDLRAFGLASFQFVTIADSDADGSVEVTVAGIDQAVFSIELIGIGTGVLTEDDFILS